MNANTKKAAIVARLKTQVKERMGTKASTIGCGLEQHTCGGMF